MTLSPRRIRAILRKELREYRRHRSVVLTMAIFPLIFLIQPLIVVFLSPRGVRRHGLAQEHLLLYMLGLPVLDPGRCSPPTRSPASASRARSSPC